MRHVESAGAMRRRSRGVVARRVAGVGALTALALAATLTGGHDGLNDRWVAGLEKAEVLGDRE
jgi:hypothetical protein